MKGAQRATGDRRAASGGAVVSFAVPLPPRSLRANGRSHWAIRKRDADAYSLDVYRALLATGVQRLGQRWRRARVTYVWCHAGVAPDHGNLGGNTKYLQDILCTAPKLPPDQAKKYRRWHLGIIANDAGIEAVYRLRKVPSRKEERCEITIERLEAE